MDGSQFDEFARAFVKSRRDALKALLGGATAGIAAVLVPESVGMAQACAPLLRRCVEDGECCSGACDPAIGRCVCGGGTELCGRECIAIEQFQTDVNNCGGCRNRCRQAPECHLPVCIDGACGSVPDPDLIGQPCGRDDRVCGANGVCACPPERPTTCRRTCVDTASDPDNCGACGNRCPRSGHGTATCTGGACGITCDVGFALCGERCCADDRECCNGDCCGPNQCCAAAGCVLCRCEIGIESFDAGEINPDNACQFCDPIHDRHDWTTSPDGAFCGDGRVCCNGECCSPTECCDGVQCTDINCPDQCEIQGQPVEAGTRNPANACEVCEPATNRFDWTLVDDQTLCGGVPGRVCCNGECCSPTECCGATNCEECGPHCRIGDEDIAAGTVNPAEPCEVCNPDESFSDWSTAADETDCGVGQVCCAGACCPAGQCCNDGACGTCRCEIGDDTFDRDDVNPFNACEICNPDQNRDDWSPGPPNTACGLTNDRFCCSGACCSADQCCNAIGECETCGCVISGEPRLAGAADPTNTCRVCDPNQNRRDWSVLDDNEACGTDADDRVCCGGDCCPQGQCCEGGTCQDCGCEIGNDTIDPGTVNPENVCEICDPSRARFTWSPVLGEKPCGPGDNQVCCGGDCCAEDQCCLLDACGECLCQIGNETIPPDTPNEANACEICNPDVDPFNWTVLADDEACAGLPDQVCCSGSCCEPLQCCTDGTCQACACIIGDKGFEAEAVNPHNPCEVCDPNQSATAWTPAANNTACGEHQICCAGTCCAIGGCCTEIGTCLACLCVVDGLTIEAGVTNPANGCEVCDPLVSTTAWSPAVDESPCADAFGQVCCAGLCCPRGQCCVAGTCGPCRCTIGQVEFVAGDRNPANGCEVCTPALTATDWSLVPDNEPCGDDPDLVCCRGVCCTDGNCCHSSEGTCGPEPCLCTIGEEEIAEGEINPENECQHCDPTANPNDWAPVDDDSPCGPNGDQVCCAGECCLPGDCCALGTCQPCGCRIEGQSFAEGQVNPDNECEVCDPAVSTTDWSPHSEPTRCAFNEGRCCGRECCFAQCCPEGACCASSAVCGECGGDECTIDGVTFPSGAVNPASACETCNPFFSTVTWTVQPDDEFCGPDGTQFCCNGVCCVQGACCNDDRICEIGGGFVCEESCLIDGQFFPRSFVNPANPCQECDPFDSTNDWSPRLNLFQCGDDLRQTCCNGDCCAPGTCCTTRIEGGVCVPCP
jgi:hypothetical protein